MHLPRRATPSKALPTLARLAATGLAALLLVSTNAMLARAIGEGDAFPVHSLEDLDGHSLEVGATGHVTLVYFAGWACGVCIDAMEAIGDEFYSVYSRAGLDVYAIDGWDGSYDEVDHFRNVTGARFPVLLNGSELLSACGLQANSFVILDDDGIVRFVSEGPDPSAYQPDVMKQVVELYLGKAAATHIRTWGEIKGLYTSPRQPGSHHTHPRHPQAD